MGSEGIVQAGRSTATYLLKLSRPRFWLYLAGPVMVAAAFGAKLAADLASPAALALFLYALLPANVFLYGVNDRFDTEIDALNPKKDDREARYAGGCAVEAAILASGAAGAVLAWWLPPAARPWLAGFLVLAVGYSAPPLRFKARPVWDSVSNGLYILPAVATYAALAGALPPWPAIAGGWLWTMAMHTFSAIPDIGPDRAAGVRTTATWLGRRRAFAYCGACWAGAAIAFGAVSPYLGLWLAIYPVINAVVATLSDDDVVRAYWWFPALNAVVGMVLVWAGLARLVP